MSFTLLYKAHIFCHTYTFSVFTNRAGLITLSLIPLALIFLSRSIHSAMYGTDPFLIYFFRLPMWYS